MEELTGETTRAGCCRWARSNNRYTTKDQPFMCEPCRAQLEDFRDWLHNAGRRKNDG